MSHRSHVPAIAAKYFGISIEPAYHDHPVIAQYFVPGNGWVSYPCTKRVSINALRGLRAKGASHVSLAYEGRSADFMISELL